jgi:hypothetical protein
MFPLMYELNLCIIWEKLTFKGLKLKMITFVSLIRTIKRSLRSDQGYIRLKQIRNSALGRQLFY